MANNFAPLSTVLTQAAIGADLGALVNDKGQIDLTCAKCGEVITTVKYERDAETAIAKGLKCPVCRS